jgi:hypothetical protein
MPQGSEEWLRALWLPGAWWTSYRLEFLQLSDITH